MIRTLASGQLPVEAFPGNTAFKSGKTKKKLEHVFYQKDLVPTTTTLPPLFLAPKCPAWKKVYKNLPDMNIIYKSIIPILVGVLVLNMAAAHTPLVKPRYPCLKPMQEIGTWNKSMATAPRLPFKDLSSDLRNGPVALGCKR